MFNEKDLELKKILEIIKQILNNKKYETDYEILNDILLYLTEIDLDNVDITRLEDYKNIIIDLEIKYDDIFDLSYYYEPFLIKIKRVIHEKEVNKMREVIRNSRKEEKNG